MKIVKLGLRAKLVGQTGKSALFHFSNPIRGPIFSKSYWYFGLIYLIFPDLRYTFIFQIYLFLNSHINISKSEKKNKDSCPDSVDYIFDNINSKTYHPKQKWLFILKLDIFWVNFKKKSRPRNWSSDLS